jgi:hypothetical protein
MKTALAFALVSTAFAACGDDSANEDLASRDMAALTDSAVATLSYQGTIGSLASFDDGGTADGGIIPVPGALVQLVGYPYSTSTASDGSYTLQVPQPAAGQTITLAASITAEGFLGATDLGQVTGANSPIGFTTTGRWDAGDYLMPDAMAETFFAAGGIPYPATTTGYVSLFVGGVPGQALAGVMATISPAAAQTVYENAAGVLDPSLTATTSSGLVYFGGVPAGPYTITVSAPGRSCSAYYTPNNWPGTGTNGFGGQVVAGTLNRDPAMTCQ